MKDFLWLFWVFWTGILIFVAPFFSYLIWYYLNQRKRKYLSYLIIFIPIIGIFLPEIYSEFVMNCSGSLSYNTSSFIWIIIYIVSLLFYIINLKNIKCCDSFWECKKDLFSLKNIILFIFLDILFIISSFLFLLPDFT